MQPINLQTLSETPINQDTNGIYFILKSDKPIDEFLHYQTIHEYYNKVVYIGCCCEGVGYKTRTQQKHIPSFTGNDRNVDTPERMRVFALDNSYKISNLFVVGFEHENPGEERRNHLIAYQNAFGNLPLANTLIRGC